MPLTPPRIVEIASGLRLAVFDPPELDPKLPCLAHLHRDEHTALAAAHRVAQERRTRLVTIVGEPERRLGFDVAGARASFDPNRAFTPGGRDLSLECPDGLRRQALQVVEAFAHAFKVELGTRAWIAVHNNSPGPPLSIRSFLAGAIDAGLVSDVHVAPDEAEDDFALVTTQGLFEGFQQRACNVAWQRHDPPDDGSLSVHAAQQGVPYVNVEALEGHLDQQVRMIRIALELLSTLAGPRR